MVLFIFFEREVRAFMERRSVCLGFKTSGSDDDDE